MKNLHIHDAMTVAFVRRMLMAVALLAGEGTLTAQWNACPPKDVETQIRRLLATEYFPVPPDSVLTRSWESIFANVDKYTRVEKLSASELKDFRKNSWWFINDPLDDSTPPPKYFGLAYHEARVSMIKPRSAAYRGGLCIGDSLIRVNGNCINGNDSIFHDRVSAIPVSDTMHLEVRRGNRNITFNLVRDELPDIRVAARRSSRTIFVRIADFDRGAAEEFDRKVGGSIGYNNVDSMIIDLRHNPGGSVSELMDLLKLFCPKGTVIFKKCSLKDTTEFMSHNTGHPLMRIPHLVILVDSNSASASEAFTGCLKLHARATVLGTRTFGKGIVQTVRLIGDYKFTMTTAEYFAGGTMKVHKCGVEPDGPVPAWLERSQGMSAKVARLNMADVREKYASYPIDIALKELGVDWSQAPYIFGLEGEVYYERTMGIAKK